MKVRRRDRCDKNARGTSIEWTEWQVVDGRKVLQRCKTEKEAYDWLEQNCAAEILVRKANEALRSLAERVPAGILVENSEGIVVWLSASSIKGHPPVSVKGL